MVKPHRLPLSVCLGFCFLSACQREAILDAPGDGARTQVVARLSRARSIDDATYESTRRLDVLVTSGGDTVYHQAHDFSLRKAELPGLPTGRTYALRLKGFGPTGDSIWTGQASFTTTGDTLRLDIPVVSTFAACQATTLDIFRTWIMSDTQSGVWQYQKMIFSEDSSYMSYTWGMTLGSGVPDTVFYGVERGSLALSTGASTPSLRTGQVRFNVLNYQQCSELAAGNPCGNANYVKHITTAADTSLTGIWTLSRDSLVLTMGSQTIRYH